MGQSEERKTGARKSEDMNRAETSEPRDENVQHIDAAMIVDEGVLNAWRRILCRGAKG
jgi:hypothetical protein